jgi:hypothetical protein
VDKQSVSVVQVSGVRRNSTVSHMPPFKTARITFDGGGWPGWYAVVRTDPPNSVYNDLVSLEEDKWWSAFGQVVIEWNLTDEDGKPHPLPKELESEKELDLRVGVVTFLFTSYLDAVKTAAAFPKALEPSSDSTSTTNGVGPSKGQG